MLPMRDMYLHCDKSGYQYVGRAITGLCVCVSVSGVPGIQCSMTGYLFPFWGSEIPTSISILLHNYTPYDSGMYDGEHAG